MVSSFFVKLLLRVRNYWIIVKADLIGPGFQKRDAAIFSNRIIP